MITKIEKVTIYVKSQQEAKLFWTEKSDSQLHLNNPWDQQGHGSKSHPKEQLQH